MALEVRRGADRPVTTTDRVESRHSFSFGAHYDPTNIRHGVLLSHNEDRVRPGGGYGPHPHRDTEIITWVLSGSLVHRDSAGHSGLIHPGLAQRMSAGTGVRHSETNDSWRIDGERHDDPVHFVQMWVAPDESGLPPGYEQRDIDGALTTGELVVVASGAPGRVDDAAIRVNNRHATLYAARLTSGAQVRLPDAPYLHLFVATGSVDLEDAGPLAAGDAVRLTASGGQRVIGTATAEILVWSMDR